MIALTLRINSKLVKAQISAEMEAVPKRTFDRIQDRWSQRLRDLLVKNATSGPLYKDTGDLAESIRVEVSRPAPARMRVSVDTEDVPYGNIHEKGGTIKPTKGQFMAIPLPSVKARGSRALYLSEYMRTFAAGQGLKVFFRQSKSDPSKLTAYVKQRKSNLPAIPIYVLQRTVKLKARRWVSSAVAQAATELDTMVREASGK